MSKLKAAIESGRFIVTSELTPPKGTELVALLDKADALRDVVTAFNLTDSHAARMAMAPMAAARHLLERGIEPIVQMTSRDRNRLALQADMLGAHALGVRNLVFMGGDPPANGDHPEAKAVFDLPSAALLGAASALGRGEDLMGNALSGAAEFLLGAVVNPGAADLAGELRRLEEKVEAGARFLQTQAVYDIGAYERFIEATRHMDLCLLTGIIPIKSPKMAQYMNANVPGISIPDALIKEIGDAPHRRAKSAEIAARIISQVRPMATGVHIMAIGWEDLIPDIMARADA